MKDSAHNEFRRLLLFAVAVLVLLFLARVYAPALQASFIWDDHTLVQNDASYRHASAAHIMTRAFWPESALNDTRAPYFRPIVLLSYRFDIALGGSPREFHFTNVALHLATCLLIGLVAIRAGASYPSALVASLAWGSLPRLTEAVAWIAGRTDVLAAFFGFAALAVWPETGPPPWRRPWARSIIAGALLFLSLASKEVGLAFGIALVVIVAMRGGNRSTLTRAGVCLGVPFIAYFTLRAAALARLDIPPSRELGFGTRTATILEAAERYAEMTLDPFHPHTSIGMLGAPDIPRAIVGAFVLLVAFAGAFYVVRRGSFGARFAVVLGAAAIFPVLQIIPLALTSAVVADRLLYVPLAGLAILLAVVLSNRGPKMRFVGAGVVALSLALGVATSARAADYKEETYFWTVAAEGAHPQNVAPRMALARWLVGSVELSAGCELYERALAMLTAEGLSDRPPHRRAREGIIGCWARLGRYDDAVRASRELAHEFPDRARVLLELGYAELHVREFDRAAAAFATAARLENGAVAGYALSPRRIAEVRATDEHYDELDEDEKAEHLAALGRGVEAAAAFLAIALDPEEPYELRYHATIFLLREGSFDDAERAFTLVPPPPPRGWDIDRLGVWNRRRKTHRVLAELKPRIDALAH